MLNVSPINSVPNVDNRYHNITILSRPLTSQSVSGQSCGQSCGHLNTKTRINVEIPEQVDSNCSHNCVESSSVVSPSVSLSMSSLPSPSDRTNGSQSLRSTVLANNANTNSFNNNNNNNIDNNDNNSNIWSNMGSNIGEKSPMCRINEISRFNDIKHEYHLIDELGPPHNKTFTVILKLGESEEFGGSGPSIKKAQRSAATVALQQTKLKQPTPRMPRHNKDTWLMTPTVELNMLAMKLGQNAVYQVYEPPRHQTPAFSFGPIGGSGTATNAYDYRGMHYQRYHMPRGPFSASLSVGNRQFMGKGHTAQAARHAAAEEALKVLRQLTITSNETTGTSTAPDKCENSQSGDDLNGDNGFKSPISLVHEMALKRNQSVRFDVVDESGPSHMPKFVTQCTVGHIVTTGEGNGKKISKKNAAIRMVEELNKLSPLVVCDRTDANKDSVAEQTTGSKKSGLQTSHKKGFNKKKNNFNKNILKENTKRTADRMERMDRNIETNTESDCNQNNCDSNSDFNNKNKSTDNESQPSTRESTTNGIALNEISDGAPIHPINRLIQLQQARKEKAPQFTLISERVIDRRRREFTIECTIHVTKGPNGSQTVSSLGLGANKKVAKKNAADQMLQLLGYSSRAAPQSILKQDSTEGQTSQHKKIRQVKFIEDNTAANNSSLVEMSCGGTHLSKLGRQLVPGLLLMPSDITGTTPGLKCGSNIDFDWNTNSKSNNSEDISKKIQSISSIAKELLESKLSICHKKCDNQDINSQSLSDFTTSRSEQLKSVAQTVGTHQLQVHFSDFPRKQSNGQSMEYLSVVTITTVWNQTPIVSHGSGQTVDESRNQASHQALIQLSQLEATNSTKH